MNPTIFLKSHVPFLNYVSVQIQAIINKDDSVVSNQDYTTDG